MGVKEYYTTGEVSEILNISRLTVSRRFDSGVFRGTKNPITGERHISRYSLIDFMKKYNIPLDKLKVIEKEKSVLLCCPDKTIHNLFSGIFKQIPNVTIKNIEYGTDALIECHKELPDIFVIDDTLPDISSIEMIKSLKRLEDFKNLSIVVLSSNADMGLFREVGIKNFIPKDELNREFLEAKFNDMLGLAEVSKIEDDDVHKHKRLWTRVDLNVPADIKVFCLNTRDYHERGNAVIKDISEGGVFLNDITLENNFIPCQSFRISMNTDTGELNDWEAESLVVRLKSNGKLSAGVRFVNISEENRRKVKHLVDNMVEG